MQIRLQASERKDFLRKLMILALPIGLQNLLSSSLSFLDTLMVGQLGVNQIAGVGLGNQMFFLVSLIFFGTCSGASAFTSQFYGARKNESIQHVMLISFAVAITGALVFALPSVFCPEFLLGLFTPDKDVIEVGKQYLVTVGGSYILSACSMVISFTMRATEDAKTPLVISVISLGTDALLNWLLIFGVGPFPRLEVYGAAIATVISRALELALLIIVAKRRRSPACFHLKEAIRTFDRAFLKPFFKTCLPVMLNEFLWAMGMTAYKMVYSHMGTDVLASVNMTNSVQDLFLVFSLGIGNAAGIMIGNQIGHGNKEGAIRYAWALIFSSIICGTAFGICMAAASPVLPALFNVPPSIYDMTRRTLLYLSPVLILKSLSTTLIVGVLRSGGDTRFSLISEMCCVWLIGLPAAIISGLVFKLPIYYVCLIVSLEELAKCLIIIPRIISRKWVNDLTA
ncbi:MAG: MATE family efflux transporter [Sphaerochaetaceae bacterium]|nr:MATE family efflux transporter [Candidatus Cloacimonadota bacterium]MDD2232855.1 MATE family efflux transporter [Sphaerochaetaceae bacterium]MDD4008087.1 MATE family efflux transporter [Sphaerochaetaceae bacterium]